MKKLLGILFVAVMVLSMALPVFAAPANGNGNNGTVLKGSGSAFDYNGWSPVFDLAEGATENVTYWHFVDSGTNANKAPSAARMDLVFTDDKGLQHVYVWDKSMGFSTNGGGKNAGWVIKTPSSWVSVSGFVDSVLNQFNLSGKVSVLKATATEKTAATVIDYVTPMFTSETVDYRINHNFTNTWESKWNSTARLEEMGWDFENFGTPVIVWYDNLEPKNGDLRVFEFNYNIKGDEIITGSDFFIAADNGFVMLVNSVVVANSKQITKILANFVDKDGLLIDDGIDVLRTINPEELYFENDWVNEWNPVYVIKWEDLEGYFVVGENTIEIIAYNTPDHDINDPAVESKGGTVDNNPAGVIFAGVVYSQSTK